MMIILKNESSNDNYKHKIKKYCLIIKDKKYT